MKQNTFTQYFRIIFGSALFGLAVNLFVVPLGLYNGGGIGIAQILRTLIINLTGLNFPFDIASIINLFINIPLFILAYKSMNPRFLFVTIISVIVQTICMSIVPIPSTPLISDPIASVFIGGVIAGYGIGVVLSEGASGGGIDIVGLYCTMKFKNFSVGKLSLIINSIIYATCAVMFSFETAVYSIIFAFIYSTFLDKFHTTNVETSMMIFTKNPEVKQTIMSKYIRGVTYWKGLGAYTETETEVLVTVVSKYEVTDVEKIVHQLDPNAFIIITEGLHVTGGYEKRLIIK